MPTPFALRRYRPEDFDAVAALAVAASSSPETACGQPDVASVDEFRADYGHRRLEDEAWVAVLPGGKVVGFAAGILRNETLTVDGPIVAESHRGQGIGTGLFHSLELDAAQYGARFIEGGVRASNVRGHEFLLSLGYEPSRQIFCYESDEPPTEQACLPEGYSIGELKPRYLLPFLMVMHECFPGYKLPSSPQRLFEPDKMKIFLALDAENRPVGSVTAYFYPNERLGYIYHLGVTEPHRKRGLARALLVEACQWLWDTHDTRVVGLSTSDQGAIREVLYERVGFDLQYALRYLRKPVEQTARA